MKVLLDTHAFLWFVLGDTRITDIARRLIIDPANEKLVSPASFWEIAIKISLRKYTLNESYETFMQRGIDGNGFHILPIEPRHTALLVSLAHHHRDPFDRLLVAQSLVERIPIVSSDAFLDAYGVERLW